MAENIGSLDTLVEQKLVSDTEFQSSLANLSEDEKKILVESKRKEILEAEFKSLNEKAEKATKAEELANNYKTRAEKVEERLKQFEKTPTNTPQGNNLSTKDLYSLMEAKVPQEDVDKVVEYAAFAKISVGEALKSNIVKGILTEQAEFRRTAKAAQTISKPSSQSRPDGYALQEKLSKGATTEEEQEKTVPAPRSAEAEELFWARRGKKKPE